MTRRRVVGALAVVVVIGAAVWFGTRPGDGGSAPGPSSSRPALAPGSAVVVTGAYFLDHYEQAGGRVVRWDQGGDTVSEGEAYAMLVSVALGQRPSFDAAWEWSRTHLMQPDGLLAWHYADSSAPAGSSAPGSAASSAADADVDAAWALTLAADRFSEPGYRSAATRLATAVLDHEVESLSGQQVLLAGPWAAGRSPIVDPSYLAPLDDQALARVAGDPRWTQLAQTTDRLLAELVGKGKLPSDWAVVAPGGEAQPTAPPGKADAPVVYGYDAVRVPIRLAASCDGADTNLAAEMWPVLQRNATGGGPLVDLDLGGAPQAGASTDAVGMVGAAAAAAAAGQPRSATDLLARAQSANDRHPTYYGSAWVALGRVLLQTSALGSCPPLPES